MQHLFGIALIKNGIAIHTHRDGLYIAFQTPNGTPSTAIYDTEKDVLVISGNIPKGPILKSNDFNQCLNFIATL